MLTSGFKILPAQEQEAAGLSRGSWSYGAEIIGALIKLSGHCLQLNEAPEKGSDLPFLEILCRAGAKVPEGASIGRRD